MDIIQKRVTMASFEPFILFAKICAISCIQVLLRSVILTVWTEQILSLFPRGKKTSAAFLD